MKNTARFILMSVTIMMTLVISAFLTVPAFADDGLPPPAADGVAPIEPLEDSVVEESAPTEISNLPELLNQLPEGTEVIVTDSTGEILPLVTEDAAAVIVSGDPIWCPTGVAPKASTGGCSPSYTSFTNDSTPTDTGLLSWLNDPLNTAAVSKAGVIWVAWNYSGGGEIGPIQIEGASVAGTMETFALTIQGGWSGTPGSISLDASKPYSTLTVPLWITGWTGAVTVKNIDVIGAATTGGANDSAFKVDTIGNILIDGVNVNDSLNGDGGVLSGAFFDNTNAGAGIGTVTVNNSAFNNNEGTGITINSDAMVTTNNLIANGNDQGGAVIVNNTNLTTAPDKSVTMKGFKQFNDNGLTGLSISSKGAITLSNITASYNSEYGVLIDNTGSKTNLGVVISGTNYFMVNSIDGLNILSNGVITLNNLNASYNSGNGVFLDNCNTTPSKPVCVAKTVTITGINNFNWNNLDGLSVLSFGTITVSNVSATHNINNGAALDNTESTGNLGVSVLGTNYFISNGDEILGDDIGLEILSHGAILANNINAIDNTGDGAFLSNCSDRLEIVVCDVTLAKTVSLTGINVFNWNDDTGLRIHSFGSIILNNLTANNNINLGVNIQNKTLNLNSVAESMGVVTLNGYGVFNFNDGNGMTVSSHSNITISNVTANENGDQGVYLEANRTTGAANVNIKGYNSFENNWHSGLGVSVDGAILVSFLTANSNGKSGTGNGATLHNYSASSALAVTVSGYARLSNNAEEGLDIDSRGAVSLTNVSADKNGVTLLLDGVIINNDYLTTALVPVRSYQNVTLLGINTFTNNGLNGLFVESYGIITLWSSTASQNKAVGLYLNNCLTCTNTTAKAVNLYGYARVSDNVKEGIYIDTLGSVILTNITADKNSVCILCLTPYDGVYVKNNYNLLSPQNVTITGYNTFNSNGKNGLIVNSYGAIAVNNINASWNGEDGAYLNNGSATTVKSITLTGRNLFFMNDHNGLYYNAKGTVSLSNIDATLNGQDHGYATGRGIWGVSTGAATLACVHTYGNYGAGYNLSGFTTLTTKGLQSFGDNVATTDANFPVGIVRTVNLLCP